MPDLDALLTRIAAYNRESSIEYYLALTGQQERLSLRAIQARYPELFARETLEWAPEAATAAHGERFGRALRRLLSSYWQRHRAAEAQERLINAEAEAEVTFEDETLPYRGAQGRLAGERDPVKRARLFRAWLSEVERLNGQRVDLKQLEVSGVRELGYADPADYAQRLTGLRLAPLRERLAQFLVSTRAAYYDRLERYAAEAGCGGQPPLPYSDLGYVMAGRPYDGLFRPEAMLPAFERTLAGLGVDLSAKPGVTMDLEPRPRKTPRAFCSSPDAPADVRLVLTPRGGQEDYATFFHEAGHMLFSSHMDAAQPYLYRHSGDGSVHESYAFLLQHLTESPAWWFEALGVKRLSDTPDGAPPGTPTLGDCLAFMRFDRLYMLRRYSAKLEYELGFYAGGGLDGGGEGARGQEYAALLTDATGFAYPAERYLDDFDQGFYVAQYLQAWIWEVQLRRHLEREFGEAWFTQRRAGDFLRELWSVGMQFDIYETAERLGYSAGLDADAIEEELLM